MEMTLEQQQALAIAQARRKQAEASKPVDSAREKVRSLQASGVPVADNGLAYSLAKSPSIMEAEMRRSEPWTGRQRIAATPELGTLPEFGATPEGDNLRIAAGLLSTFKPDAQVQMIRQAIPEAQFTSTPDGSVIIEVPTADGETRRSVLNRPGLSPQDVTTTIAQTLAFVSPARLAGLGKSLMAKIGIGGAGAAATEQGLQELGVALGREDRDPTSTAMAGLLGGGAEAVMPAIQGFRNSRNAKGVQSGVDELADVEESVNTAREASDKTGIPLFQAQQTGVPATLEKQSFVAQLPAGTKRAMESLRNQNQAAGDAVESFLNTIADSNAVVTGPERARNAARSSIENMKRIRAERSSPLYKEAFEKGADVEAASIVKQLDETIETMPEGGEVSKTLKRIRKLMTGTGDKQPSLQYLHNVKLEIDQMLSKQGETSLGNTTKRHVTEVKDMLLDAMDKGSSEYRQARDLFAQNSPAINALQDSVVGKIARLDDVQLKQVASSIFDPAQTNPRVLMDAKKAIQSADSDAWNEIVRTELERRLGSIKATTEAGTVENLPGQLYRALFPNEKSTKVLMNALDDEGKKNLNYLRTALGRARLGRPGGSQTAARQEIKEELKGGVSSAIRDFIREPISSTANYGVNTLTMSTQERALNQRVKALADTLYDPSWKAEMKALRKLDPDSPASARAMAQLLRAITESNEKFSMDSEGTEPEGQQRPTQ